MLLMKLNFSKVVECCLLMIYFILYIKKTECDKGLATKS